MIIRLVEEEFDNESGVVHKPIYVDYTIKDGDDKSQIVRAMVEKLIEHLER